MDNTGRMSGTINKQWFLYQEKEVFQDKRQKKLILGIPNELEKGGEPDLSHSPNLFISWFLWDMKC